MKKCASCSKDLPDAALHCVFCGAKQAPAPAVSPNHAKTAFGYSQNEVMDALGSKAPAYAQEPRANRPSQMPAPGQVRNPISPSEHDAATVLVPTTPQGAAGGFNNQQGFAATDYGTPRPQLPPGGSHGVPAPPANLPSAAPYGNAPSPYGSSGAPYGGAQSPGYGNPAPSPNYGNPQPGYGNPAPSPSYGAPQPNYGSPQPGYGNPQPGYGNPQPSYGSPQPGGMGIHSTQQRTEPVPTASPPYRAARGGARPGWPIDPWKDSIKLVMFIWGAVALVTFATPAHVDPMGFMWDVITDAPGKAKLIPLLWAAAGLLAIACAAIPMPTLSRGIVAGALGLGGILVPLFMFGGTGLERHATLSGGMPPWQVLVPLVGALVLIPGLLVRNEYTESIVPRIMITVGVVAVLVPLLVPDHSQIPLVNMFKGLIDAPGKDKLTYVLQIVHLVIVVMTLLAWMPGPATGGAKIFAWTLILFPIAEFGLKLALAGHIGDTASKMPIELVVWAPGVVYNVLSGYGLATIIGTQLE